MLKSEFDTIAAIATPIGEGGISVLRVSGTDALSVVAKLFRGTKDIRTVATHTAHVGFLHDLDGNNVDEVVCVVFRSPNSYTGEDVVEISCHGGLLVTRRILELIIDSSAIRSAEPGEFTKRSFLNGKMDLAQAEAVADMIHAKSDAARSASLHQLQGGLSKEIRAIRNQIIDSVGLLELELDFAEDGYELTDKKKVLALVENASQKLTDLINSHRKGKLQKEGAKVVLVGAPNVGKSSLLNRLLQENRAIVTEIPGTTRDVIEESIEIERFVFRLVDTAGLRETADPIEEEGIRRTNAQIESADIVLFLIDSSRRTSDIERTAFSEIKELADKEHTQLILVANKIDLDPESKNLNGLANKSIKISATENLGIEELKKRLLSAVAGSRDSIEESTVVSNRRHVGALESGRQNLEHAIVSLKDNKPGEFVVLDLRAALDSLGEIIGEVMTDEILESVFSKFCVGK
jgi:tRNA modification GTPase